MAIPGIQEIQSLATKYSKAQLQKMAQMGLIDPTKAVMAGMMIDRIQKQNMQPPQQTVAEEVMGAPAMPQQAPQQNMPAPGIAGLPSGLPEEMAGGGIVAFADGGDTDDYADGGAVRYADRGLVDVRNDPMMRIEPRVQAQRDDVRYQILAEELRQAQARLDAGDPRAKADVEALQREMRNVKPRTNVDIPLPGISEAKAADLPKPSKPSAPSADYYQDPFGAPDYTTEGFSLKEKVAPGKPYEPSIRGMLFGYERAKPEELPPIRKPEAKIPESKKPETFAPPPVKEEVPEAKKEDRTEPPRPGLFDRLKGLGMEEPKEISMEEALGEQESAYSRLGVDKDLFTKIRQDYENTRGKFQDRADKAAGHALMMFGAGLLGARRGSEFETASKSAQQALGAYMTTMDKLAERDDKLDQSLRELSLAEDQYRRSRSDAALARVEKRREKIDQIRLENAKLEATAQIKAAEFTIDLIKTEKPALYQTLENIAAEQRAKGNPNYTTLDALRDYQGLQKTGGMTLNQALEAVQRNPLFMGKTPAEQMAEAQRMIGGAAPAGGGKVKFLGYE